jgi:hypothetical protein
MISNNKITKLTTYKPNIPKNIPKIHRISTTEPPIIIKIQYKKNLLKIFITIKHMKETEIAIVNFPPLIRSITNMLERIKGLLMVELHIKKRILWKTERRITM